MASSVRSVARSSRDEKIVKHSVSAGKYVSAGFYGLLAARLLRRIGRGGDGDSNGGLKNAV